LELSEIICTLAEFESVRLLTQVIEARARFSGGNIEIIEAPVDDTWIRDIAPTPMDYAHTKLSPCQAEFQLQQRQSIHEQPPFVRHCWLESACHARRYILSAVR
jgi:hypothetical protein